MKTRITLIQTISSNICLDVNKINNLLMSSVAMLIMLLANAANLQAQVVVNEILPDGTVELKNIGTATVDVSSYWLCHFPDYQQISNSNIISGEAMLAPGAIVAVDDFNVLDEADGELGLYVSSVFSSSSDIIDYVEWGSTGHQRSSVAIAAGIWNTGDFVASFGAGESLEYDGEGDSPSDWAATATPSIGEENSNAGENCEASGGTLEGGPFAFCVDGESDFVSGITLTGNEGTTSQWVITDEQGNILGLPPMPGVVDFDGAGGGTCLIWNVTYDEISGLEMDLNIENLEGCFDFSNSIAVVRTEVSGGTLEGGPFTFCVDGEPDFVSGVTVSGNIGANSQWVITDDQGKILGLPPMPEVVNFDEAGAGVCNIYNVSFEAGLVGLSADANILELEGCFSLSNPIPVTRVIDGPACDDDCAAVGGVLEGGPFEFCVDGEPDFVSDITLSGNTGTNSQWIITDDQGKILGLPPMPGLVNFDGAGAGVCNIYNISFEEGLEGLVADANISDLEGCFSLSNAIAVTRNQPLGGIIEGGPFEFCVDGIPDMVSDVTLTGNEGTSSQWIVTDSQGKILGLPPTPETPNFDGAGPGVCLIYHLSFYGEVEGLSADANINNLTGCYSLSNYISVVRTSAGAACDDDCDAIGGTVTGGPFEFCVDGVEDFVTGITLEGNSGTNNQWVVTDDQGKILGLPPMPGVVNFDEAGGGVCLIVNVAYEDGLEGLSADSNLFTDLVGCYSISNAITVVRNEPLGGTLEGGPFEFCVDGVEDFVTGITLTGNAGPNSQWIITDDQGKILGLPPMPGVVNFDGAGAGVCNIYNVSFENGLEGLAADENISDLVGCFSLSNAIPVTRVIDGPACETGDCEVAGGVLEGGPFFFCIDGEADFVSGITLSGNDGATNQWVVTDQNGKILGLPPMPGVVNFDDAGLGLCLIWNLASDGPITGLEPDMNIFNLEGCYDFSNHIRVNRSDSGAACRMACGNEGGTLSGGPFTICVDGDPDFVSGVDVSGNNGTNNQWVITDANGKILGLPPSPDVVNFDDAGLGSCLIWNISYEDNLVGLEADLNIFNLEGCHDFSNNVRVNRVNNGAACRVACGNEGGTLTGGPFTICIDGEPDFVSGVAVSGNNGSNNQWVVTDQNGNILGLPPSPDVVNFDDAGTGECLIWNVSFEDDLVGLEADLNIFNLEGCHDFSNHVRVIRVDEGSICGSGKAEAILESVRVFPNPASNFITVSMEANGSQGTVTLVNTVGQMISKQLVTESTDEVYFSLEDSPAGIYFININIGEQSTTKKVVVTKGGSLGF